MPSIGDELIYRLRDNSPSECVRVSEIDTRKKTPRYVVEFLDGNKADWKWLTRVWAGSSKRGWRRGPAESVEKGVWLC
ncbi:hypothetical protein [Corynebacterium lubricantis]|uniref:hypothetical protein n=1 Tax=Corynebacterium lubricantis TaxID=541095 RepID=UPI00037B14DE|nr:hypothetical protein [Corynebacterium lubricantis]